MVHEDDVLEVREGEVGEKVIRVAHYAVQPGTAQDVTTSQNGEVVELQVEPFEENPQAKSVFLADDLDLDLACRSISTSVPEPRPLGVDETGGTPEL